MPCLVIGARPKPLVCRHGSEEKSTFGQSVSHLVDEYRIVLDVFDDIERADGTYLTQKGHRVQQCAMDYILEPA